MASQFTASNGLMSLDQYSPMSWAPSKSNTTVSKASGCGCTGASDCSAARQWVATSFSLGIATCQESESLKPTTNMSRISNDMPELRT
jgi:hypothetical protein